MALLLLVLSLAVQYVCELVKLLDCIKSQQEFCGGRQRLGLSPERELLCWCLVDRRQAWTRDKGNEMSYLNLPTAGMYARVAMLVVFVFSMPAQASDLAKEKRWADQIVDALLDGESLYVNDGTSDFLAIHTEPMEGDSEKGVLVMHGTGIHPDWQTVIQPLRVALAEQNWHTLSIQMPILENEAPYEAYDAITPEAAPRIKASLEWFAAQGVKSVALVAHSRGATMAAYYLANIKQSLPDSVVGFAAVGMGRGNPDGHGKNIEHLAQINLPVLDLYGSEDLEGVLASAPERAAAARGNERYQQVMVDGADHFFEGHDDALIEAVHQWLGQL